MRIDRVAKNVIGSAVVYLVMAACASKDAHNAGGFVADGGSGTGHDADGATIDVNGNPDDDSSVLDAIANPVPDAKADPDTSGTRLKARRYVGSDGSSQFVGWRDTKRNEDCGFLKHDDGTRRCLPTGAFAATYYSDPGCTLPVFATSASNCAAPSTISWYDVFKAGCGGEIGYRVFSVAGPYTAPTIYSRPSATTCTSSPRPTSVTLYGATAEIPASEFVEATVKVD